RLLTRAAENLLPGDPAAAVPLYEQAIELDPLRETLYQGLMRCYQTLHRPAEVEHVYRRCRDTLKRELGLAPSEETETLIKRLRAPNT
ncbi:MAG: bacterial transcriptional activator domain-containing protein, partial [Pseudomonadota bacterium]